MLFSEIFTGSAVAIDATERSLMASGGTTTGVPQAIDGARWYRLIAKFASIVAADNFKFRVYRAPASGAAQEVIDEFHVSFAMSRQITYYWEARYDTDITVQRISSNSRNLTWTIEACDQAPTVAEIQSGLATAAALATVDDFVDTEIAAIQSSLATIDGRLDTEIPAILTAVDTEVASLVTAVAALPTAAQNADAVWDEAIAGHAAAGSTGEALSAAAAGGGGGASVDDILNEPLAGHAGAGTVGAALIVSRDGVGTLATAVDALPTNAELATALDPLATAAAAVTSAAVDAVAAALAGAIAAVQADTDDIQARIPATLDGGNMRAQVKGVDAGVVTTIQAGLATAAGFTAGLAALVIPTAAQVATQVWGTTLEGARSAAGLMRTLARVAVGAATQPALGAGTYTYRDLDDTKDAVVIEIAADARTRTSLDDT